MATGETIYVNSVREQLLAGRERLSDVLADNESEQVLRLLKRWTARCIASSTAASGYAKCARAPSLRVSCWRIRWRGFAWSASRPSSSARWSTTWSWPRRSRKGCCRRQDVAISGWEISYHYQPAGMVSGDYCDVIKDDGHLNFIMADVSGKGVAAAMLASNLRAVFRSLIPLRLSVEDLMVRANRLFHESALPHQYATLVFGRTSNRGELELANAGHLPVLLASKSGVKTFESNCKPLGFFSDDKVDVVRAVLSPGDTVVLYTDGVSEASNRDGEEYGVDALRKLIAEQHPTCCPVALVKACKQRLAAFRGAEERADDETLLAIQYMPGATHSQAAIV